ncbi:MAG: type III-A CRISPR-associated protein Cas10/Csm1 [Chloroflexota bacterium]
MREETLKAALAGLLHDIGKFSQRADTPLREIVDDEVRAEVKYSHALASYSFVQDFAPSLPANVRQGLSGVVYHHVPKSDLDELVRLADWLASGEREELDGAKDDRRVPYLRSTFSRLCGFDEAWHFSLARLHFDETLFPSKGDRSQWRESFRDEYFALWEEFERACEPLKTTSDPMLYLETLYNRMLEFTWCIPSAYYNAIPDVSLYDHSRMTAAMAACLAQDRRDGAWCYAVKDDDPVAVLVGGDISGVQRFIYTLASSGAARTLRGRSFYVQLLTEVVAEFLIRKLGLPPTNVIYVGGGNFYLLVGVEQQEELQGLGREVTRRLVKAHKGELHLTLACTVLKRAEFERARFADAWRRLHENELLPAKHKPLAALDDDELFALVGAPLGVGGDNDQRCSICGTERQKGEHFEPERAGAEGIRKCELCRSFERLGNALAHATHLVWLQAPVPPEAADVRHWQAGLANFGARIALINAEKPLEKENTLPELQDVTLARLSEIQEADDSAIESALGGVPLVRVTRPLAKLVPRDRRGDPLTFDELAEKTPLKRWGVLRMDVDGLGRIFQQGFRGDDGDNLTLSRLASLSLGLRLFFEGWLPRLAQPQDGDPLDLSGSLYLQYAGGDDLFVVGAWDALPRFAERVCRSFADYVCKNPKVTLSGGVSLASLRFPLYQAARDAEKAEKAAKDLRGAKNAMTFLNQPVAWEQFGAVLERAYELAAWCKHRRAPKSLIQTLIEIAAEYDRTSQDGKLHFGRWMWVLAYQLTRAAAHVRDRQVKEGIIAIRDALLVPEGLIRTIGLSARWAELLSRE